MPQASFQVGRALRALPIVCGRIGWLICSSASQTGMDSESLPTLNDPIRQWLARFESRQIA